MNIVVTKEDCLAEIKRLFKYYYKSVTSEDADSVREVLSSIYSVNDKLRKANYPDFFGSDEFLTLKAIRNFIMHQSEIHNESKAAPILNRFGIKSELGYFYLIPVEVVNNICLTLNSKNEEALKKTCIFYKKYVDIYPCIFNFMVHMYFYTVEHNLSIDTKEYSDMKNAIQFEKDNGYSHFVSGQLELINGDIDEFLETYLVTMNTDDELRKILYSEDNGMSTLRF